MTRQALFFSIFVFLFLVVGAAVIGEIFSEIQHRFITTPPPPPNYFFR